MKSQLLEVENYFIHLNDLLKIQSSNGFKLTAIYNFLSILLQEKNYSKYISYFSDLSPYIVNLINDRDFEGLSPSILTDYQIIISKLDEFNLFDNKLELIQILEEGKKNIFKPVNRELVSDYISIVLIEENSNYEIRNKPKFAEIRKLHLAISSVNKGQNKDKVEFKNLIDLRETDILKCLLNSIMKAKELCKRKGLSVHNYNFSYYFDKDEYIYTGTSLCLAATSLAFNSILIYELSKQYYKFRSDCVMTGMLDEEGNLVKIDNRDYLELKIKGVFFSGYSKLIIPEENYGEAIEIVKGLNLIYPEKKLDIIPVKKFENIFTNLEIVERFDLKFTERLKANYKKYNTFFNWTLSILLVIFLALMTFDFIIPRIDRNPVEYGYIDDHYTIFNKYGIELWRSRNLPAINKEYYFDYLNKNVRCILTDVNRDDLNELIYLIKDDDENKDSRSIFCSNSDIKNFPVELPLRNLNYPNDPVDNVFFYLRGISLIDCNSDSINEIIFWGANTKLYPGIIGAIDFSGHLICEYWNEGHPNVLKIFDLNNSGNKDILVGGCNNRDSLECAALIIFDPKCIKGSSPYSNPLSNDIKGTEKYYILFPKSILFKFSGRERNDVYDIRLNSNNTITCWISEGTTTDDIGLGYQFDGNMNLIGVECNDKYKNFYDKLREEKKINSPDIQIYLNNLKSQVRWWNGDFFASSPSINKNYLKAINAK